jgi:hypothetical protein
MREHLSGMTNELDQELVLKGRQAYFLSLPQDLTSAEVDVEVAEIEDGAFLVCAAHRMAHRDANARE